MIERRKNVLIIAEGYEEKPYIDKVLSFPNIDKDAYNIVPAVNVKGNGNISARYQFEIQRDYYDIILIFCDADKGSEQFYSIINDVGERFFVNKNDGKEVFIFANPVTLQIVLSHFGDVCLTKVNKSKNVEAVERLTGVSNYSASQEQIQMIMDKIHYSSMDDFKRRLETISTDYKDIPSTNFLLFLKRFESFDNTWVDEINKLRK